MYRVLGVGLLMFLVGGASFVVEVLTGLWVPWVMHAPIGSWVTYWSLTNVALALGGLLVIVFGIGLNLVATLLTADKKL